MRIVQIGPYFRHIRLVGNLHLVPRGKRAQRGFTLVEAVVALAVLGIGVSGAVAVGGAGRRLAEIAAVRTAQVRATRVVLGSGESGGGSDPVSIGGRELAITADTTPVVPGLVEIRVIAGGTGVTGAYETVTRRPATGP